MMFSMTRLTRLAATAAVVLLLSTAAVLVVADDEAPYPVDDHAGEELVHRRHMSAEATINRTLCTLTESATIHVKYVTEYYASTYPGINWGFKWVGGKWWPSAKDAARWWAINGNTQCDGLVGPGWSSAAIAMSPLVDTAWIDPSATSTELSDKTKHSTFSRDIPTDAVAASLVADVMSTLGWKKSNVFCVDDTYGRSLFNGFKDAWTTLNNTLETGLCLPSDASDAMVANAVAQFVASQTRTLYIIFRGSDASGRAFLNRLRPHATAMNLFFSESLCDLDDVISIRSGLCLSYFNNQSKIDNYLTAYKAKNFSSDIADLVALGGTPAQVGPLNNQLHGYAMFVHDAAHHMMKAMYEHKQASSTAKLYAYLRTVVSVGATGTVRLNERGDRVAVDAKVINYYHDRNGSFVVGHLRDAKYVPINGTATEYSFLGLAPSTTIPSDSKPVASESSSTNLAIWIPVIVIAVLLVLVIVGVVVWALFLRPKTRDNSTAPKDPRKPYAMVFTDIQASTKLWARAPEHMGEAIDLHHAVIRQLINKYGGYEVKTIGDAFMVAFQKPRDALDLAVAIQQGLYDAPWSADAPIDDTYEEILQEDAPDLKHPTGAAYDRLWRGLRVRVGVHYGTGEIKHDETTLGYDYYGTVVNTAARVEAVGHGGQVLVTAEAYDEITESGHKPLDPKVYVSSSLGAQPLRGLNEPVTLFQVLPINFSTRQFPALRLDMEIDEQEEGINSEHHGESTTDGKSVGHSSGRSVVHTGKSAPEDVATVCSYLVKRLPKTSGIDAPMFHEIFEVLKTMFATTKPKFRTATFKTLAERWRVQPLRVPGDIRAAAQGIAPDDSTLLTVLVKAASATDSKRLTHGNGGSVAYLTRLSTFKSSNRSSVSHLEAPPGGQPTQTAGDTNVDADINVQSLGNSPDPGVTLPVPEITEPHTTSS